MAACQISARKCRGLRISNSSSGVHPRWWRLGLSRACLGRGGSSQRKDGRMGYYERHWCQYRAGSVSVLKGLGNEAFLGRWVWKASHSIDSAERCCGGARGQTARCGEAGNRRVSSREELTLSPESTTRRPSSRALYCEDFEQRTTRLHFRLRCSSRRALERVSLIASAVPKIAEIPTRTERTEVMSS